MVAVKYSFRTAIELALAGVLLAFATLALGNAKDPWAEDRSVLVERLQEVAVYAADFTQSVYGLRGELLERSEGYVRLQRPQFKWVVNEPYPQVLVTEGEYLKLYDPDLEQLTIRPLEEALRDTPVSLLTQEAVVLGENFNVMRIADGRGQSFVIEPTAPDTLYREILLHFNAAGLSGLDILDHLGQRTEIRFDPVPADEAIGDDEFTLEVPPGTDVIGG
ncbi:MAG: outer membrane lipoprotein chaperone LolA [Pseudomonadales bacterium]